MRLEDQDAEKGIVSQSKAFRTLTCRSTCRTTSPCRANPRVLLLSLRKEALQIMAGFRARSNPSARHRHELTWQSYQLTLAVAV